MKTNLLKSGLILMMSAFLFTACEKSDNDMAAPASAKHMSISELASNPQFVAICKQRQEAYMAQHPESRVAFVDPFFTSDGFYMAQNLAFDFSGPFPTIVSGQFAGFSADLGPNDFYRENNDGTISVHINSNTATAEHFDFATGVDMYTNSGHLNMDYTGEFVSFDITDEEGNVIFTISFIDYNVNPNAVSFHGNGRVRENGTGPAHNLVGKLVANPGWTQVDIGFDLH